MRMKEVEAFQGFSRHTVSSYCDVIKLLYSVLHQSLVYNWHIRTLWVRESASCHFGGGFAGAVLAVF
jgi:hypothetical protein